MNADPNEVARLRAEVQRLTLLLAEAAPRLYPRTPPDRRAEEYLDVAYLGADFGDCNWT